jgi:hypothetical protein
MEVISVIPRHEQRLDPLTDEGLGQVFRLFQDPELDILSYLRVAGSLSDDDVTQASATTP